ncbi:MAG: 23S rRNA (guanosine(2251)-2'-O)-methyltransferase RlmB [Mycoplasmataceae bacterium]|nr:23S rRNA (guanosine(2251)-2'-O)-methyltransferase RlmB [Mycoplasmataceae bacterium]
MSNLLFGKKALLENINSINKVHILKIEQKTISLLKAHDIPFIIEKQSYFAKFNKNLNHQNIVCELKQTKTITLDELLESTKQKSIILVLDSLQDPQNFGAIIRSAEALGVDAIIYKKDGQVQINDFVIKSSTGAINHIPLIRVTNLVETIKQLKQHNYWVYCSTLNDKSKNFNHVNFDDKVVLIVGNEQKGVSPLVASIADFQIKIPMYGSTQSLNVSVATGILLNHIAQKHKGEKW